MCLTRSGTVHNAIFGVVLVRVNASLDIALFWALQLLACGILPSEVFTPSGVAGGMAHGAC